MTAITKEERRRRKIARGVSKMTPDTVQKMEKAFALDSTVEEACFYANISTSTYYTWIKNHPDLLDRFTALRTQPILKARQTIIRSLDDPNHAFRYLEKKRPEEFGNRSKIEVNEARNEPSVDRNDPAIRAAVSDFHAALKRAIIASHKKPIQI